MFAEFVQKGAEFVEDHDSIASRVGDENIAIVIDNDALGSVEVVGGSHATLAVEDFCVHELVVDAENSMGIEVGENDVSFRGECDTTRRV